VKRSILWLGAVMVLAGCETTTDPLFGELGGGAGAITPTQASGNWTFTLQQTTTLPACSAPLANSQIIISRLDVSATGTLNTTSSWANPISGAVDPLSGTVVLTSGITDLFFTAPEVRSDAQMELRGTMTASGGFNGTLTDPEPGFSQVFGTGGCEYTVSGIKTS
jgi:hypothetical protein